MFPTSACDLNGKNRATGAPTAIVCIESSSRDDVNVM